MRWYRVLSPECFLVSVLPKHLRFQYRYRHNGESHQRLQIRDKFQIETKMSHQAVATT